jgi:secreted protein with Ig-like and vWFA domain
MSHDKKNRNPDLNLWIDPELEARVIAWVLGEVSDFEAAELERLVEEKPELGLFRKRIQEAHELAAEAMGPDTEKLRLSPERRAELLSRISAPTEETEPEIPIVFRRSLTINWRKWVPAGAVTVAASFVLVFGVIRMGLRHTEFGQADLVGTSLKAPPPPVADYRLPVSSGLSEDPLRNAKTEEQVADQSLAETEYFPQRQLDAKSRVETSVLSEPAAEFDGRTGRDKRPMAAGLDSSASAGYEHFEKKQAFGFGDLDRVESNKPASAPSESGRRNAVLVGGAMPGPDAGRQRRTKEVGREQELLSSFEVSKDDHEGRFEAVSAASGSKMERRDALEVDGLFKGLAEQEAFLPEGQTKGEIVSLDPFSVSREVIKAPEEVNATEEPVSTFSLHVSDVSFRVAQAALVRGDWPEPSTIRPEEFYNAFDYGDPAPTTAEKISCRIDQAAHPVLQQRNLVRIAMQVPATGRGAGQPLHLTVMVDTSGSMEREDRRESVVKAMDVLSTLLGPEDRINLVGFARRARLLEEAMPGSKAHLLTDHISNTPSEGGTNLEEALDLSVQLAQRHFGPSAQNRIVLITDGAANLGNADPETLAGTVTTIRQQGIAFDACGVGTDGLNDTILEALTRKGDGRYYVLDRPEDADEGFAEQLAGAFRPAAENVKVQVRFNPARVGNYRLIGFEKHRLNEEDFRNDRVDAAELAAEEAAVALYQVEVLPDGEGELGEVYVRFRDAATGEMVERSWTAPYDPHAPTFDRASAAVQLAGTAAVLAEVLRGDPNAEQVSLDDLAPTINHLRGHYAYEERVQKLIGMYEDLRRIHNTGAE